MALLASCNCFSVLLTECTREKSSNSPSAAKVRHTGSYPCAKSEIREKWSLHRSGNDMTNRGAVVAPCRNSSTKDLTQFAAEAIAFNRQLSQHDEQQEDAGAVVCTMRLSPPSNSRLARRRAQSSALRSGAFQAPSDNVTA